MKMMRACCHVCIACGFGIFPTETAQCAMFVIHVISVSQFCPLLQTGGTSSSGFYFNQPGNQLWSLN